MVTEEDRKEFDSMMKRIKEEPCYPYHDWEKVGQKVDKNPELAAEILKTIREISKTSKEVPSSGIAKMLRAMYNSENREFCTDILLEIPEAGIHIVSDLKSTDWWGKDLEKNPELGNLLETAISITASSAKVGEVDRKRVLSDIVTIAKKFPGALRDPIGSICSMDRHYEEELTPRVISTLVQFSEDLKPYDVERCFNIIERYETSTHREDVKNAAQRAYTRLIASGAAEPERVERIAARYELVRGGLNTSDFYLMGEISRKDPKFAETAFKHVEYYLRTHDKPNEHEVYAITHCLEDIGKADRKLAKKALKLMRESIKSEAMNEDNLSLVRRSAEDIAYARPLAAIAALRTKIAARKREKEIKKEQKAQEKQHVNTRQNMPTGRDDGR